MCSLQDTCIYPDKILYLPSLKDARTPPRFIRYLCIRKTRYYKDLSGRLPRSLSPPPSQPLFFPRSLPYRSPLETLYRKQGRKDSLPWPLGPDLTVVTVTAPVPGSQFYGEIQLFFHVEFRSLPTFYQTPTGSSSFTSFRGEKSTATRHLERRVTVIPPDFCNTSSRRLV